MGTFHDLVYMFCFSVANPPNLQEWNERAETFDNLTNSVSAIPLNCTLPSFLSIIISKNFWLLQQVRIAMVGKYVGMADSYLSVVKVRIYFYLVP